MSGTDNPIADAPSHVGINTLPSQTPVADFKAMATAQLEDPEIQKFGTNGSSLTLQPMPVPTSDVTILCDVSTGTPHLYIPSKFR